MPSVVFYNTEILPDGQLFDTPEYQQSYRLFSEIFARKGGRMYVVRGLKNYAGENSFLSGWFFDGKEWVRTDESFAADIIFNRGFDFPSEQALRVVNSPEMERRCKKHGTAELFPDDCPVTVRVDEASRLQDAIARMKTDLVVFKPLDSYGGYGVSIVKKSEADIQAPATPYLLQEFIDTSKGIPGLCDGRHDLRITFFVDSLPDCYLRHPAAGEPLSNLAQGGSIRQVALKDIPQGARALAFKVDAKMADQPDRIYCVDMGLHDGKEWKIIELNAPPGMPIMKEDSDIQSHMEFLADHFLKIAAE